MKKLYIILMFTVVGFYTATAQNRNTKQADKHYDRLEYVEAIEEYSKLVDRGRADEYVYKRLADANYHIYNTREAERYYAMIVDSDIADSETIFRYAQMLKANQKFDQSNQMMRRFAEMEPNDERARQFLQNPDYLPRLLERSEKFAVEKLGINSPYYDFGSFVKGNQFYFASSRNTRKRNFGWTGEPVHDIYVATIQGEEVTDPQLVEGDVNSNFNEGIVTITPDGTRMYFDRTDIVDGDYESAENGIAQIQLMTAEFVNGRWRNVRKVPFSTSEYSFGHPAISPDGRTLYFVSDMPGGRGGSDIYRVSINEDGSFGEPENLGDRINTPGRENTPFISSDGTLYFSSDGHLGLGGLDVFYAERNGDTFGQINNVGRPVNSAGDDLAYTINQETQQGYVTSNRGTEGSSRPNDDIYRVRQLEPLCEVELIAAVRDVNTRENLSGATVTLYDTNENQIASRTTGANGQTRFEVECDRDFVLQVNLDGYESQSVSVSRTERDRLTVDIDLNPIEDIVTEEEVRLNPIHFDFDKANIKAQAAFELDKLVQVMERNPEMRIHIVGHTDNRGSESYNQQLSERRARSARQYVISKGISADRLTAEGRGETDPKVACGNNCTEEQHQQNRRSEFRIVRD